MFVCVIFRFKTLWWWVASGNSTPALFAVKFKPVGTRLLKRETEHSRTKWPTRLITLLIESLGTLGIRVNSLLTQNLIIMVRYDCHLCCLWITGTLKEGLRPAETAAEDVFIRKFVTGTWHNLFTSEVIIKRQHNIIRIAGIIVQTIPARKMVHLSFFWDIVKDQIFF